MKKLASLLFILFTFAAQAQDSSSKWSNHAVYEQQIKTDRHGTGNNTFSVSVTKLSTLVKKLPLKTLEAQLGEWVSYGAFNTIGYEWNDKTREHDIPNFQVKYETTIKGKFYALEAEVPKSTNNPIKKLTVIVEMNGMELAKFKKSLADNGYLVNDNLTQIFRKQTWQKEKGLAVTIKKNANGTLSIGIF